MAEYQERNAPASPFTRAVRMLGPGERIVLFLAVPVALVAMLQVFAQVIVVVITRPENAKVLGVFSYLGLWGAADPAARYGVEGAGALHWGIVIGVLAAFVTGVVLVFRARSRRLKDPQRRPGLADRRDVEKQLGEEQLVEVRGPHLRGSIPANKIVPTDVGYRIGNFREIECWARVEDPMIIIGPSRAGKGFNFVLPWIMDAPGAVITTSSKLDNALMTILARERAGSKCWIFAPGVQGGTEFGRVLRWDPVQGCVDEATLVRRIKALIPGDSFSGSTSNGGHWDTLGQQLASHLFHAAACGNRTVDDIWDWVSNPKRAEEAVRLIREHPEGMQEHARHLETVINMPHEQRASQWGVLPTVLAFMESRTARDWMKPSVESNIDLVDFVLGRGTLYLVGDKKTSAGYLRIIDALLSELDFVTKGLAAGSPGGRLDPPVTYLLDEAGNFEYQGLNELITAGGGVGRIGVAVFQSKSQLRQYGGQEAEDALWDAATVKIVLPGGGDPKALEDMAKLIGETWVERETQSMSFNGPAQSSVGAEKRTIFSMEEIRTLEVGFAFLFYRNLKAVVTKSHPFSEHAKFDECVADSKQLAQQSQQGSPYAAQLKAHQERHLA